MAKLLHAFVSAKIDSTDTTKVRPSDWNDPLQYANAAGTAPSGTDATVRQILTAGTTTFYVDFDNGNDTTGTGTQSNPFKTPQAAGTYVESSIDLGSTASVTIQLADSASHQGCFVWGAGCPGISWLGGSVTLVGNASDASQVRLEVQSHNDFNLLIGGGMTLEEAVGDPNSFGNSVSVGEHAELVILSDSGPIHFGPAAGAHVYAYDQGKGSLFCDYTISDDAQWHWYAQDNSEIGSNNVHTGAATAVTISGSRTFSSGVFIYGLNNAQMTWHSTFSGTNPTCLQFFLEDISNLDNPLSNNLTTIPGTLTGTRENFTVAGLPSGYLGLIAVVNNANAPVIGSIVAGGAAAKALVWYNGANWTVIGK